MRRILHARLLVGLVLSFCFPSGIAHAGELRFPRDHGNHPEVATEWWVFTGHVKAGDGRWFAYQAAFYRLDVPTSTVSDPVWGTRSLHPASIAVTDLATRRFLFHDRLERNGVGTAAAGRDPIRLEQRAWRVDFKDGAWTIAASEDSLAFRLTLVPQRSPVGIATEENREGDGAPRRYTVPGLTTSGTIRVGQEEMKVRGISGLDHLFGEEVLRGQEAGWDILHLSFRDGSRLTLYRIRSISDRRERRTGGIYMTASGVEMPLETLKTRFYPQGNDRWMSPTSGGSYPVRWQVEIPVLGLDLVVTADLDGQELPLFRTHGAAIWRGSVEARGSRADQHVAGAGFLEMVGYAGRFPPILAEVAEEEGASESD